jgi:anti-anti-sigma regulatory factor
MVLRIEKVLREQLIILRLSGRIQSEHVEELKAQMEGLSQRVVLDLGDVKLVDRDAITFLAVCESNGVELRQCSPYIRDWIGRERTKPLE